MSHIKIAHLTHWYTRTDTEIRYFVYISGFLLARTNVEFFREWFGVSVWFFCSFIHLDLLHEDGIDECLVILVAASVIKFGGIGNVMMITTLYDDDSLLMNFHAKKTSGWQWMHDKMWRFGWRHHNEIIRLTSLV